MGSSKADRYDRKAEVLEQDARRKRSEADRPGVTTAEAISLLSLANRAERRAMKYRRLAKADREGTQE